MLAGLMLAPGAAALAAPDGRSADARCGHEEDASAAVAQRRGGRTAGVATTAAEEPRRAAQAGPDAGRRSPGKPTAPISVRHEWLEPPVVGRDLRLKLTIGSNRPLADVVVRLGGREGLVVDAASTETRVEALAAGGEHAFEPAVYAALGGTHYLAVSVTATIDGARQTRSVTIPVRLGGDAAASAEPAGEDAKDSAGLRSAPDGGERVRSLPAEERRR